MTDSRLRRAQRPLEVLAPTLAAPFAFILGAVLILTGAAPITHDHLAALESSVPVPALETAHLASLLSGLALMGAATGLWRRRASARMLALFAATVAAGSALARGFDWGPTISSLILAVLLAATERAFYRRSERMHDELDVLTDVGVLGVFAGSVALGLWCYKSTPFDGGLFTRVGYHADPARFIRGTAVLGAALLLVAAVRLTGAVRPRSAKPDPDTLERLRPLIEAAPNTLARLALTGDKSILASPGGEAFVMWASEGRSMVVLGDPVGDLEAGKALMWRMREQADRIDARAVFYQVSPERLADYLDLGLALVKLGEEALVPLADFSITGPGRKRLRQTHTKAVRDGLSFELVHPPVTAALMAELSHVSHAWLARHGRREKGFSLGRFDPEVIRHDPVGVVRLHDQIVAFANVWRGGGVEASVDLMRHRPEAPAGVMEYLLIELMQWAKSEGFERFNLRMAPLSGLGEHRLAPLWHKIGRLVARRGSRFYGFEGLRAFKQKFDPVWTPRYLAAPPRQVTAALIDVARLIARPWSPPGGAGQLLLAGFYDTEVEEAALEPALI
jgi:phosphatidylglycerol lysyltransferase